MHARDEHSGRWIMGLEPGDLLIASNDEIRETMSAEHNKWRKNN
jgi:hypothetical protein